MAKSVGMVGTLMVGTLLAGCTASQKQTAPLPSGTVGSNSVTVTSRVKDLDQQTRVITLERAGSRVRFRVDDSVRNLPQVRVGDEVTVTYSESVAYQVKKPGDAQPGRDVAEEVERAPLGEKPGATAARVATVTTTIAGIDKAAGTVTLRDPDGNDVTVRARNPHNLDRVTVGDLVEITYTEAVAVKVDDPAAAGR